MQYGKFIGQVETLWVQNKDKDRYMVLLADFSYMDPEGRVWLAERGKMIDGASIPSPLWGPSLGSPFVGDYRRASVIHDVACDDRVLTSNDVHRMFYLAMLCDGVRKSKAQLMYAAVRVFGPQWNEKEDLPAPKFKLPLFWKIRKELAQVKHYNLDQLDGVLKGIVPTMPRIGS